MPIRHPAALRLAEKLVQALAPDKKNDIATAQLVATIIMSDVRADEIDVGNDIYEASRIAAKIGTK